MNRSAIKFIPSIVLITTATLTISCKKDRGAVPSPPPKPTISIDRIDASIANNINVAKRENNYILLRGVSYSYSLKNGQLTALPIKEPYQLPYNRNEKGTIQSIPEDQALIVQLVTPGYLIQNDLMKDPPPPKPLIKDQNSEKDLVSADMLLGKFSGLPANILSNISLLHANNLLDLYIVGITPSQIINIKLSTRGEAFQPMNLTNNRYQAVFTGNWYTPDDLMLVLNAVDGTHSLKLVDAREIKQDRHYHLTIKKDQDKAGYMVIDNGQTKWSDEKWPQ